MTTVPQTLAGEGVAAAPHDPGTVGDRHGRIILVRHGRPQLDRKAGPRLDWRQYRKWWSRYESTSLAAGDSAPAELIRLTGEAPFLFSSPRPRAVETARAIAADREIRIDWLFVEAAMPPPHLPRLIRFRPYVWDTLSRTKWLFAGASGDETRRQASLRAEAAAETLDMAASERRDVILVAHGWFNRMLWLPLLQRGWHCVQGGGNDFWSYRVYVRGRSRRNARRGPAREH